MFLRDAKPLVCSVPVLHYIDKGVIMNSTNLIHSILIKMYFVKMYHNNDKIWQYCTPFT